VGKVKRFWKRFSRWFRCDSWLTLPGRHKGSIAAYAAIATKLDAAENEVWRLRDENAALRSAQHAMLIGNVPGLSPAEIERLALLVEECGEAMQAAGKVLRHGWRSSSPFGGPPNNVALEREIGDVHAACDLLIASDDMRGGDIGHWRRRKRISVEKYLHHQPTSEDCQQKEG